MMTSTRGSEANFNSRFSFSAIQAQRRGGSLALPCGSAHRVPAAQVGADLAQQQRRHPGIAPDHAEELGQAGAEALARLPRIEVGDEHLEAVLPQPPPAARDGPAA